MKNIIINILLKIKKNYDEKIKIKNLIRMLKNKQFIFVNGEVGVGKTKLISTLKKKKEFENYGFDEWSEYLRGEKRTFLLRDPKFIEIHNVEDINFLISKSENPEENIKNFWEKGILINLNIKGNQITDNQGKNYYAYAFHLPLNKNGIISIENFLDNNKVLDIYITDLDWLQERKILFESYKS